MYKRPEDCKNPEELRAFVKASAGILSESQRQMLLVAASQGKDLEPAGPLAGKPDSE